jgi:peptidoglycan/xylan/chitin deacetylase (PgdA/CDA1 family)
VARPAPGPPGPGGTPAARAFDNRRGEAVFLCYHSIAEQGVPYLALPAGAFERQLDLLRRLRYRSGGVEDLRRLARGERLRRRTVFLTFDDGYRDTADVALPMLLEFGFRPLVFVLPRHLDQGAGFDWPEVAAANAADPDLVRSLTWSQLDEVLGRGGEVGSHTLTHPHLCRLDDEQLRVELAESKDRLERRLGPCEMLAYPFGEWNGRVARAASSAGYSFAFSLPQGPQSQAGPLCIPRLNVDHRDGGGRFAFKLSRLGRRFLLSEAGERVRALRKRAG